MLQYLRFGRPVTRPIRRGVLIPLPFPFPLSLPIPSPTIPFSLLPSPPFPLEVGPLNLARGLGSAVSSPSGVWGGAPAEIEFGAY